MSTTTVFPRSVLSSLPSQTNVVHNRPKSDIECLHRFTKHDYKKCMFHRTLHHNHTSHSKLKFPNLHGAGQKNYLKIFNLPLAAALLNRMHILNSSFFRPSSANFRMRPGRGGSGKGNFPYSFFQQCLHFSLSSLFLLLASIGNPPPSLGERFDESSFKKRPFQCHRVL